LLALPSAAAFGQAPPSHKLFVAPYQAPGGGGGSGLVAAKLSDGLKTDLAGRTSQLYLIADAAAPQAAGGGVFGPSGPGAANLAAARNHVKVGTGLLQTGRFEEAMGELAKALALFEANLAFLKDETELVEVHLAFAAAAFQAGYEDDGEAALLQALAMQLDLQVGGRGYPPLFEKLSNKFRRRLKKKKAGIVKLASNPTPATVFVDGREVGETPLELDDLVQGGHYLRLVRPMSGVWAQKVVAPKEGEQLDLAVDMPAIGEEAALAQDKGAADLAAQQSLQELSATLGAGIVDARLKDRAYELSLRVGATHVVCGLVSASPTSYRIRTFLLRAEPRSLADLGSVELDPELLELGVRTHEVAERIVAALHEFPEGSLVPDVMVQPPPVAVAAPAVAPAPAGPAPAPPPGLVPIGAAPAEPAALTPLTDGPPAGAVPVAGLPGSYPGVAVTAPPPEPPTIMPVGPIPPPVTPETEGVGWYRRWWVWTAVGVIVVGGAAAAAVFLVQPEEQQPDTFSVQWSVR